MSEFTRPYKIGKSKIQTKFRQHNSDKIQTKFRQLNSDNIQKKSRQKFRPKF